jgi:tetrahydrodipicolinate N-succinyltransferase
MYQYETLIDEQWVAIVRYDCVHGFFHRDVLFPNGDKEKQSIEMDSLKIASKYAEQDLKDRWEWYRERYIKKLKTK